MRLFTGIPPENEISDQFIQFFSKQNYIPEIRWIPRMNLHITICFFGDTHDVKTKEIISILKNVIPAVDPFFIFFKECCFFPPKNPRMIWARYHSCEPFTKLVQQLYRILLHTEPDKGDAIPHITLARFKAPVNTKLIDLNIQTGNNSIEVNQLILWESILKPTGSDYSIVEKFRFRQMTPFSVID